MADWVSELLEKTKIKKATLVGHSMGSLVALEFAARYPAQCEQIALIGVAYPMKVSEAFLDAARRNDQAAYDMETIWGHAAQVPFARQSEPGHVDVRRHAGAPRAPRARRAATPTSKACNAYAGGMESAAKVKCPALFVLGARDMMTPPRAAEELVRAMRDAKTVTIGPPAIR